jgi:two-component system LytT family sensor kinase
MTPKDAGVLVNIIGFITGATLYAMLLVMVLRSQRSAYESRQTTDLRRLSIAEDLLPLATAILGLFWNVGALAVYGLRDLGVGELPPALSAAAFTALGFLPAVVVHSALRNRQALDERKNVFWLVVGPYALSLTASILHFHSAVFDQIAPSRRAMLLLTLSFGALIVPMLVLTRRQPDRSRVLWVVALSVFAVSALHLSHHEGDQYSWPVELIGHHSSLPLALAILYQDYRFALADIFLKRALSLVALVALAFGLYLGVAAPLISLSRTGRYEPLAVGAVLGMWVATALAYPVLRRSVGSFVDRVVLRRPDYDALRAQISGVAAAEENTNAILDGVCRCLAPALSSRHTTWVRWDDGDGEQTTETLRAELAGAFPQMFQPDNDALKTFARAGGVDRIVITSPRNTGAVVIIPTTEPPPFVVVIGELSGGRRLMSDDLALLEAVSFIIARRIDALRIIHERCEQSLREQEIGKLATEAELRALRAQINPHFLFNALTTIGYLIQTAPARALGTLMRLTELLRRVLRSGGEFVTLSEEIALIESYLEIEQARFEERLKVSVQVPASLCSIRIPPLLIQPLVENAVLHGIAPTRMGGEVLIAARIESGSADHPDASSLLCITVRDTGAGVSEIQMAHGRKRGLGLANVEQRLRCYYGAAAGLSIESTPGAGTTVEARMPVSLTSIGEELLSADTTQRRRA